MKRKPRKIWINKVFKEVDAIHIIIQDKINLDIITKDDIDIALEKLHDHYKAINDLKKSFSPRTFFTGYIE